MSVIELTDGTLAFGGRAVLSNIAIAIRDDGFVGMRGANWPSRSRSTLRSSALSHDAPGSYFRSANVDTMRPSALRADNDRPARRDRDAAAQPPSYGAHARRPRSPGSSRRRARPTAPPGPRRCRARQRTPHALAGLQLSLRYRHAVPRRNVNLGPRDARQRRLRPLDCIAQHLAGLAFPRVDRAGPLQHLQRVGASRPSHGDFGMSGSGASATTTSASRKMARSGPRIGTSLMPWP